MIIPTEPIGSIPRPLELLAAIAETDGMDAPVRGTALASSMTGVRNAAT